MTNELRIPNHLTVVIGQPDVAGPLNDGEAAKQRQNELAESLVRGGRRSPLARALAQAAGTGLASFEARPGWGYFRGLYCATLNINLEKTRTSDGKPIETCLSDRSISYLSALVGVETSADWVQVNRIDCAEKKTDPFGNPLH